MSMRLLPLGLIRISENMMMMANEARKRRNKRVTSIDKTSPNLPAHHTDWGRFIYQMLMTKFLIIFMTLILSKI